MIAVGVGSGVGEGISIVDVGGEVTSAQAVRNSIDARAIATIVLWIWPRISMIDASFYQSRANQF
jgi:hypothetical protein